MRARATGGSAPSSPTAPEDEITGTVEIPVVRGSDTDAPPIGAMGRLVCLAGPGTGRVHALSGGAVVIGRSDDVGIQILGDDVSRHHARVIWAGSQHVLEDLGSRNGTWVNGMPVTRHALRTGDRVQIGGSAIFVYTPGDDLEQRAQRLQKLESLSHLAGGIVHDLKNTLVVLAANLDVLEQRVGALDEETRACIGDMREAVGHTGDLTQRLLYFARRDQPTAASRIALRSVVDAVLGLVRRPFEGAHGIRVDVAVSPALHVRADTGELHHVLLNLALNARDAMPSGGRLAITARIAAISRADALRLHLPAPGRYVELAVSDTGIGMDAATLARAFEPFFTTKREGEGTGLGLATVYGIVRRWGGNVHVDSAPGEGACFRIFLPDAS
jgi:signal transduction histidine kinase